MKILLTGSSGLIGDYLAKNFPDKKSLLTPTKEELDVTYEQSVREFFDRYKPEVVIHAAGATGILSGEQERDNKQGVFWTTNVGGSQRIILNCKKHNSYLIYFSAEVVFAGRKERPGPYSEDDLPEKNNRYLSWYGQTKKEVERLIRSYLPFYSIVRISSIVGSGKQPRPDYLRKIIQAYLANKLNPMFNNQFISLAENRDVLTVVYKLMSQKKSGTFHIASSDRFTPYELTKYLILKVYGLNSGVIGSKIEDYLTTHGSTFPQFSGLSAKKTEILLGVKFSSWKNMVDDLADELKAISKK